MEETASRWRLRLIVHPTATRASTKSRAAVRLALVAHDVEELETTGRDHATVLAREPASDGTPVICWARPAPASPLRTTTSS